MVQQEKVALYYACIRLCIVVTFVGLILLAWGENQHVHAQSMDPLPHPPAAADTSGPGLATINEPEIYPATVPIGAPGLSFRHVQTFGEAGAAYFEDSLHLNFPIGLAADGNHVWVSELHGRRALKYTNSGQFVMQIGRAGISDVQGVSLRRLADVAIDRDGNVWLADEGASQVLKFDATGKNPTRFGTTWNCGAGDDQFCYPVSIAFDSAGRRYVSDGAPYWSLDQGNHRVQVFDTNGAYLATIGSTRNPGSANLQFDGPRRITIYDNLLYVADAGNHRVQILNITNPLAPALVGTIGVTGQAGGDNAHLRAPSGVAVDADFIYVADTWNHRVQLFSRGTRAYVATLAGSWGDANNQLKNPTDVAVDAAGNLFVADMDNVRVQVFNRARQYARTLGMTGVPYLTDGAHFYLPRGVAVDSDGALYITEEDGHRLTKLAATGQPVWSVGRAGLYGGWNGENDLLNGPDDVALRNQQVYVADKYNHRIQVFNTNGGYVRTLGESGQSGVDNAHFDTPHGIGFGPDGSLYVADSGNHRIQIFDANFNFVGTMGVTGQSGTDNARFNYPRDVVIDSNGFIYVADTLNHRVQVFNASRAYVRTLGVTGQPGQSFDRFREPSRLAVDAERRLYVADGWNSRIQLFDATGAYLTTIGGGGSWRPGDLHGAFSVAVDNQGNVYAGAYWDKHLVQKFTPGVPNWRQRNINGFGDRERNVTALAPFGGFLYAGTTRWPEFGAQLWRMDASGVWSGVVTDGFGVAANVGIDHLIEFQGKLYAGVWNSIPNPPYIGSGGQLWRSANGVNWEQVVSGGFDDPNHIDIFRMAVYDDHLFASTWSYTSTLGTNIWRSSTGDAGDWTQVAANGFGDLANMAILSMQVSNDQLFVGTRSRIPNGADIWRYDGATWHPVITDGFGDSGTYAISALTVFNGYLYAGTGRYNVNTRTYPGGQIWRCAQWSGCDQPGDWDLVTAAGFGRAQNVNITGFYAFGAHLYAATYNDQTGMEIWRTADGIQWWQAGFAGLGDSNSFAPNWDSGMAAFGGDLYVGVINSVNGGKVWQYLPDRVTVDIADPALAHSLIVTSSSGARTTIQIPANALDQPTVLVYEPFLPATLPPGFDLVDQAFELNAYRGNALVEELQFQQPVTMVFDYADGDLGILDEGTLTLQRWNPINSIWEEAACGPYTRQPAQNRLSVPVCHLSQFGLFGQMEFVYLPAVRR